MFCYEISARFGDLRWVFMALKRVECRELSKQRLVLLRLT